MKMDPRRVEKIVSSYVGKSFFYNTIIDLDDDYCVSFADHEKFIERTFDEFVAVARDLVHPLFRSRLDSDMSNDNLRIVFAEKRTLRVEVLMLGYYDKEYHWYRLRLVPIDDGSGHAVFFFNMLLVDDDVKNKEKNNTELFNKTVLLQLIYNYILVYVIDLSNELSRLVYSNDDDEYDSYAKRFDTHLDMMQDLCNNFVSEDFVAPFQRFMDYEYIRNQFAGEKDRLVLIFRDKRGRAYEMTATKYPEYAEDYPLVIFALKEIN